MVKRYWEVDELIESWTLLPKEMELLGNKTGENRIGFAVLLKFFSNVAQFPLHPSEVPETVLTYIGKQVKVPVEKYADYDWQGRTIKYHRAQIRKFLNFREATVKDASDMVKEYKSTGLAYRQRIHTVMRSSYASHYRRMVPKLLEVLEFRSNNEVHRTVIQALELLKKYAESKQRYYSASDEVPIEGVLKSGWREILLEKDSDGNERINRINYEISVLQALRERLRCKEIWVVGANRYRHPDEDLPTNFEVQRQAYYQALTLPLDAETFITNLQQKMSQAMHELDQGMPKNQQVSILNKRNGSLKVSPFPSAPEPMNLARIKAEINQLYSQLNRYLVIKLT